MQNSGVSLMTESQHFATVHDDNLNLTSMPYFGHQDVQTIAIGRPKHFGRVHAAGVGVTIK